MYVGNGGVCPFVGTLRIIPTGLQKLVAESYRIQEFIILICPCTSRKGPYGRGTQGLGSTKHMEEGEKEREREREGERERGREGEGGERETETETETEGKKEGEREGGREGGETCELMPQLGVRGTRSKRHEGILLMCLDVTRSQSRESQEGNFWQVPALSNWHTWSSGQGPHSLLVGML
uniref:Uncharacterized protein n=1 Tax=Rousettus aegyptiacus TaxID=9407 RepID=A0A7J8CI44_ROUAE|nr:hypothetical protein HJG63_009046 [Rousettus aegyptiacus]